MSKRQLAIFDLDYTLTKRGTWGRLVWRSVKMKPHLWLPLLISTITFQYRYKRGDIPRGDVKKNMMHWGMTGRAKPVLEAMAETFAAREVLKGLRPGGLQALEAHKAAGDYILIASAAVDLIVKPIAHKLAVEGYVCTRLDWSETGNLLPDFASENCYGAEKLRTVQAYVKEHGLGDLATVFYTDSYADVDLMQVVDRAVAVDPDDKLLKIAQVEGFDVQNWL